MNTEMDVVRINMNDMSMTELRQTLSQYPIRTRLSLTGTIVVARDIAHAKLLQRIQNGTGLPDYMKNYIVYYAGPAKTPAGYASGSFGPSTCDIVFGSGWCICVFVCGSEPSHTLSFPLSCAHPTATAGRMDAYVDQFMEAGGSFITLAKGNRSKQVTKACQKHGGFYLGSIGGPAAILAQNCIKSVSVLDHEEDGMEAVWKIDVENFPAFIVVDDKGEDFFKEWLG